MTEKFTRRSVLSGAAAAAALSPLPLSARPLFFRSGKGTGAAAPSAPAGTVTSFSLDNTSTIATSLGIKEMGMPFKYQDVPSGNRLRIERAGVNIDAQFDGFTYYPDGSLRYCVCTIRDTTFAAGESRSYNVVTEAGSYSRASTVQLSSITGASNFRAVISNVTGFTSGLIADQEANFNTHAAVATRTDKYMSGAVVDAWEVWGMFKAGSTDHLHLKAFHYAKRYKDNSGNTVALGYLPVLELNWWTDRGVANSKERFTYDASLFNGAVLVQNYGAIEHVYHSHWAMVRMTNDDQHATMHWFGANRPTLHYRPNRQYWISTGMVPPVKLDTTYGMPSGPASSTTYIPGSSFANNSDIQATGGYNGRGIIPNNDLIAFARQTPTDTRTSRVMAFTGLHIPMHRRSSDTRQRPSNAINGADASSDIANTIVANIYQDERSGSTPSNYYDFTAQGMPAPYHAFTLIGTLDFDQPVGGTTSGGTTWFNAGNVAHCVAYSYFNALYEGERYMIRDCADRAAQAIQEINNNDHAGRPVSTWYDPAQSGRYPPSGIAYPGATSAQWSGVFLRMDNPQATRELAWRTMLLIAGYTLCPAEDPQWYVLDRANQVNAKFIATDFALIPSQIKGFSIPYTTQPSPWMDAFEVMAFYTAYERTRDTNWLVPAHHIADEFTSHPNTNMIGMAGTYWALWRPSEGFPDGVWQSGTNDAFGDGLAYDLRINCTIDATTDIVTITRYYGMPWSLGDPFYISDRGQVNTTVPSELQLGTIYYAVPQTGDQIKLSTTSDGLNIVNFTNSYSNVSFGCRPQLANTASARTSSWTDEGQGVIAMAAYAMAYRNGQTNTSQAGMDKYNNYWRANTNLSGKAVWNLTHPPTP